MNKPPIKMFKPFPITSVCRADLEAQGFKASRVSDSVMSRLAEKMANAYTGNDTFWIDLDCIADNLKIPKKRGQ